MDFVYIHVLRSNSSGDNDNDCDGDGGINISGDRNNTVGDTELTQLIQWCSVFASRHPFLPLPFRQVESYVARRHVILVLKVLPCDMSLIHPFVCMSVRLCARAVVYFIMPLFFSD